jgi:hypothetical protein
MHLIWYHRALCTLVLITGQADISESSKTKSRALAGPSFAEPDSGTPYQLLLVSTMLEQVQMDRPLRKGWMQGQDTLPMPALRYPCQSAASWVCMLSKQL